MTQKTEQKPKVADLKTHLHLFRLNDEQEIRYRKMLDLSGAPTQTKFILSRIFGWAFKVVKIDKGAHDYYNRLTSFYYQYRMIANNYNQTVKAIHTNFNERRAIALLAQLDHRTIELMDICKKMIQLTEEFNRRWSPE